MDRKHEWSTMKKVYCYPAKSLRVFKRPLISYAYGRMEHYYVGDPPLPFFAFRVGSFVFFSIKPKGRFPVFSAGFAPYKEI
jgi:hypothetical protein